MENDRASAAPRTARTEVPPRPRAPRWVKAFAVVGLLLLGLLLVVLLSGGQHGPSRHSSSSHLGAAHDLSSSNQALDRR